MTWKHSPLVPADVGVWQRKNWIPSCKLYGLQNMLISLEVDMGDQNVVDKISSYSLLHLLVRPTFNKARVCITYYPLKSHTDSRFYNQTATCSIAQLEQIPVLWVSKSRVNFFKVLKTSRNIKRSIIIQNDIILNHSWLKFTVRSFCWNYFPDCS